MVSHWPRSRSLRSRDCAGIGTAYLSAEPGAPPFIKIGDAVAQGQTLMVVEAMKTFNPIPAPRAGKVTAILVGDAQPVEYGEPLVILE